MKSTTILFAGLPIDDLHQLSTGRDECLYPYLKSLRELSQHYTIKLYSELSSLKSQSISAYIIFNYDKSIYHNLRQFDPAFKNRSILIRLETPLFSPLIWNAEFTKEFLHVLSFNNLNVDASRYSYLGYPQIINGTIWDNTGDSTACIAGNNLIPTSNYTNLSLLDLRNQFIEWILTNDSAHKAGLYGKHWNLYPYNKLPHMTSLMPRLLRHMPSRYSSSRAWPQFYKGTLDKKKDLPSNYGFLFCPENTLIKGYLSEKLVDAINIGRLPIYYGALALHEDKLPYVNPLSFPDMGCMLEFVESISMSQRKEMIVELKHAIVKTDYFFSPERFTQVVIQALSLYL